MKDEALPPKQAVELTASILRDPFGYNVSRRTGSTG